MKKRKAKAAPDYLVFTVATDPQFVQMQEYDNSGYQPPAGTYINVPMASLADLNGQVLVDYRQGQLHLQLAEPISAISAQILGRLLTPFQGLLNVTVTGTYTSDANSFEVVATELHTLDCQVENPKAKGRKHQKFMPAPAPKPRKK